MQTSRKRTQDWSGRLFIVGLVFAGLMVVYGLLYLIWDVDLYQLTPLKGMKCGFLKIVGLYCPGCGGTRAFLYLARGRVLTSLYYHPLPVYLAALYLNFMVRYAITQWAPASWQARMKPARFRMVYVVLLIVLVLGNWVLRNGLLLLGYPIEQI